MNEREALLRAIAANPADDTVRLAFADWLDEHDEPDRAEFIRLQVERERSGRKSKNSGLPPRERELLDQYQTEWLGPLASLKRHEGFECAFRRGFVESMSIYGCLTADHADTICEHCPTLTKLDVIGVRGFGKQIANSLPKGIRNLRLEDWPLPDDVEAIAKSPHFSHLESLSFWLGSENDENVCLAIGAAHAIPGLKRIELIQLMGGLDQEDRAAQLDARSDQLAAIVDTQWKQKIATVYRPCSDLLPLAPYVGWNLHSGVIPDGRQVSLHVRIGSNGGHCHTFYFDAAGSLLNGEVIHVTAELHDVADYRGYNEKKLYEFLEKRMGFRPELIHVHEFAGDQVIPNCWTRIFKFDGNDSYFIACADSEHDPTYGSREEQLKGVVYWYRDGNFCITHGGDTAWAGQDGTIHTT